VLLPILKKARVLPEYTGKCSLQWDRLVLNGTKYGIADLHMLPAALNPIEVSTREDNDKLIFYGQGSPLSNFHKAKLKINNRTYNCTEQYIQYQKATLFDDDERASRIMLQDSPLSMKKIANTIRGFEKGVWERHNRAIVKEALLAKFSQHDYLHDYLKRTGHKILAEGTRDKYWGIGISLNNVNSLDMEQWSGDNLMGLLLQEVRGLICKKDD